MISLRLLGPLEVAVDGAPAPPELLWRKNVALLVYLAMAPDRRAGRERLTTLLWGDRPEAKARRSLAEALRIVRRDTGGGVEDAGSGYIRLGDGAVRTDADRFRACLDADDPAGAAALVKGEFMEGFALADAWDFEEWLASQRSAWRTRCEAALVAAAAAALDAGEPERARELAGRALALVPTSDVACRLAMKSLCFIGERAQALELFAGFERRLDEEIGILPSEETTALMERIREQRVWRLPVHAAARAAKGAESRRARLVGRAEPLAALVREWQTCRETGALRVVMIAGESGTGRTRLLQELLARAELDGAATAMVRAVPADRRGDGVVLAGLARAAGFDPSARDLELADALRAAAEATPLVLAVDDAGWADDDSLDQLVGLPARAADAAVLLALAADRPPGRAALERLEARLARDVNGIVVTLGRLPPDAMKQLAEWAFPALSEEAVARLARRVAADTAGYPLLAVELLHAVAHGLSLDGEARAWPEPGRTLDQTRPGDLPDTLVAAVRVGFRVLTEPAQRALTAAAVLDPPVPPGRIGAAARLEGAALDAALDELEWECWLVADARGYTFVARLVCEIVARDMVTSGQRARMIERAG